MAFKFGRRFPVGFALSFVSAAFVTLAASAHDAPRPNVLLFVTDDQRWDALGCMNNPVIQTPNVDRLAADGALFTNAFCTTSICMTSRASFITGQYERRHGIDSFGVPLDSTAFENTFPQVMRGAGYRIGFVGKWGLGGTLPKKDYDFWAGFEGQGKFYEEGDPVHLTRKLGDAALKFLDGCSAEQPFCLQVSFKAAHVQDGKSWPFPADTKYDQLYAGVPVPRAATANNTAFDALPSFLKSSIAKERWYVRFATPELFEQSVRDYYRLITGVDHIVGEAIDKLRAKGLGHNTVIIFTSDNGFYLGEHGLAGKWFMHEESIRLPLVIYDPRAASERRGVKVDKLVLNIDVAPTILRFAGLDVPQSMQGRSLVELCQGENPPWRTDFLYEHRFKHPKIPTTEGVRTTRWKYIRYTSVEPIREELFDLHNDPLEQRDLAGSRRHIGVLQRLRKRWVELAHKAE